MSCSTRRVVALQLFLIDNDSPDGTGARLEQTDFGGAAEVIRLPKNIGFGSGHNQVLPRLNSRYHAVINPDIELSEDSISTRDLVWMNIPMLL